MTTQNTPASVPYEGFRDQWLVEIKAGHPSTVQLGNRFSTKLLTQWLDIDVAADDLVYCDGSGDGGIDLAYLQRGEGAEDGRVEGDVWYLVQSKYGKAFAGTRTLLEEGQKVVDTLDGRRTALSSLTEGVLERLTAFRRRAGENDRIVLVFATLDPLSEEQRRALQDVQAMGRGRLGGLFDVQEVSVAAVHRQIEDREIEAEPAVRVALKADLQASGPDILVGAVPLLSLYEFLKLYRHTTGDLDELYEKNVRRFLGSRRKVNKAMQQTLRETPERFGLFNNGVTIVVSSFRLDGHEVVLDDPYVVNGCQTTRSIWEVFQQRLETGGTGPDPMGEEWRKRAAAGAVVTKVVKVGAGGEALLQEITRYTNSQTAVTEKDFLALSSDFRSWAKDMEAQHGVFLEIQRGGWDSRRAAQKQNPSLRQFDQYANAFDLLKVYAAGWLGEAGTAFGRNAAFVPGGTIFKRIVETPSADPFNVEDLYAAYRLFRAAEPYDFGRGAEKATRRQTRFLYYMVVGDLLKDVLMRATLPTEPKDITRALTKLLDAQDSTPAKHLLDNGIEVVDEYLTSGSEDAVHQEPAFKDSNGDLNSYLKLEQLGKSEQSSPRLRSLLASYKKTMGRPSPGARSPRDIITAVIRG